MSEFDGKAAVRRHTLRMRLERTGGHVGDSVPESLPVNRPPLSYLEQGGFLATDSKKVANERAAVSKAVDDEFETVLKDLKADGVGAVQGRADFLEARMEKWKERAGDIASIMQKTREAVEQARSTLRQEEVTTMDAGQVIGLIGMMYEAGTLSPREALEKDLQNTEPFLDQLQHEHLPRARSIEQTLRFKLSVAECVLWRYTIFGSTEPPAGPSVQERPDEKVVAAAKVVERLTRESLVNVTSLRNDAEKEASREGIRGLLTPEYGFPVGDGASHLEKRRGARKAALEALDRQNVRARS